MQGYGLRFDESLPVRHFNCPLDVDESPDESRYQFRDTGKRHVALLVRIQRNKPDDILGVFQHSNGMYVNVDTGIGYVDATTAYRALKSRKPRATPRKPAKNPAIIERRTVIRGKATVTRETVKLPTLYELGYNR